MFFAGFGISTGLTTKVSHLKEIKSLAGSYPQQPTSYAIGEIILVVVGILIALQINNLNEESKSKDFENKMLTEIRNSLNQDLAFFTNHLSGRNEQLAKCISNFLKSDKI